MTKIEGLVVKKDALKEKATNEERLAKFREEDL